MLKRIRLVVFLGVALLAACSPWVPEEQGAIATSVAVQVPQALALAISGFLVMLLAAATVYLFEKFNLDLRGYATPVGLALGTWIVAELQKYINTIPTTYDPWVDMILRILVIIFVTVGALRLWSSQPRKLIE